MAERRIAKIVLVCSYPPPYAGMSIYAERLSAYLMGNGFDCKVIDIGRDKRKGKAELVLAPRGGRLLKYFSAIWLLCRTPSNIVHINCSSYGNFWASLLMGAFIKIAGRRMVLTVHGGSFPKRVRGFGISRRWAARLGLSFPDAIICVNERIRAAVLSLGATQEKVSLIPAFCRHYLSDTIAKKELPHEIIDFCASHNPVLVSGIVFERIYGWETLLAAFAELRSLYQNAGLIIMGKGPDKTICAEIVEKKSLSGSVLMPGDLPHPIALTICKELADVMIRPTMVDGDSSFVREGVALCKPVVASDTDFRPEGVILFKIGDASELAEKVEYALEHVDEIIAELSTIEHPDYFAKTVILYESVLSDSSRSKAPGEVND
ncbi:glycosyltransferase family 4 protein [bacterium]|nr:glycosyltransferase family 4 protein [bacterium]